MLYSLRPVNWPGCRSAALSLLEIGLPVKKYAIAVAALAIVATACSGTTVSTVVEPSVTSSTTTAAPTTTVDPDQAVVFGSGSIPETMPGEFPFPQEAVIGSTLIDRNRNVTEVVFRVPAGVEALAQFFNVNLPNRGYTVNSSDGTETMWDLAFSGNGSSGTIAITFGSQDVSQAVVQVSADA